MITPTKNNLIVRIDTPEEKKGKFQVADTNKYLRLNHGVVEAGDEYLGKKVYFRDFQGVDIAKDLTVLHKDDIVAYEK